ncbi:MAG: hypothetical protein IJM25_00910 [Eubacterium sp.]|nr:hypothetical protein [Eubacterium sp.]
MEENQKQVLIGKRLYAAICNFERSREAREEYYSIMDTQIENRGKQQTIREQVLRVYAMLFCDDLGMEEGLPAGPDEVEATADRLYIGTAGFDPDHWYRMKYHFPVIDEDNYDRFAALVLSDLKAGPLHEAVVNDGDMLLVGEKNPLLMTLEERESQQLRKIDLV